MVRASGYNARVTRPVEESIPIDTALITSRRIPYYSPDVPFMVAWAQKAGCTSILKWFLYLAGLEDEAKDYVSGEVGLDVQSYQNNRRSKSPGYRASVIAHLESGGPVINFIRCPYQRAFSSYLHLHNRFFGAQYAEGVRSPGLQVRLAVLKFVHGRDVGVEFPITFLDYLEWLARQDTRALDPHHRPQRSEIYKYQPIRHFRLEDFAVVIRRLEREFDLRSSEQVQHAFTAGHHQEKSRLANADALQLLEQAVPLDKSSARSLIPEVSRNLLEDTRYGQIISAVFGDDIAVYDAIAPDTRCR